MQETIPQSNPTKIQLNTAQIPNENLLKQKIAGLKQINETPNLTIEGITAYKQFKISPNGEESPKSVFNGL